MALADVPLASLLAEPVIAYEADEVTRLIIDGHDPIAFARIASLTVGEFREFLLIAEPEALTAIRAAVTPEMAAAVSKLMRLQDLVAVAAKCRVVTRFRNTIGLPGRLSVRLQPNHPTDDPRGVAASTLDGLLLGAGDAVIGVNPATDSVEGTVALLAMLDAVRNAMTFRRRPACWRMSPPPRAQSNVARRWIWCSSRSAAPRRRTAVSASRSPCCARHATRRCR